MTIQMRPIVTGRQVCARAASGRPQSLPAPKGAAPLHPDLAPTTHDPGKRGRKIDLTPQPLAAPCCHTDSCVPNASNCGRAGAPCCVSDGGSTTNYHCDGGLYCATNGAPVAMCETCPEDWRQRLNNQSWEYSPCGH